MEKFVDWLSHNPAASIATIVAFSLVVVTLTVIYTVAFFQGRTVSFWPPKIGPKPLRTSAKANQTSETPAFNVQIPLTLDKGAVLVSSSGERYSLAGRIASSSSAALFLASSKSMEKVVAKVFWVGLEPDSAAWESFNRELQVSEILHHRNIARIFDRGIAGGYPFLIMEHFAGGTLRDWLDAHDRVPGAWILSISTQIADAIDYGHSQGVLHRDVKPSNILFESDAAGRVAVSDFGIARLLGAARQRLTADDAIVGTVDYMSPEALRGAKLTASTDVYAFGVLLFEMIARHSPYQASTAAEMVLKKISEDAPDIRKFRDVSAQLSDRVRLTLSTDPQKRPSSARNVLAGIESDLLIL